jgi:hypothetical protein
MKWPLAAANHSHNSFSKPHMCCRRKVNLANNGLAHASSILDNPAATETSEIWRVANCRGAVAVTHLNTSLRPAGPTFGDPGKTWTKEWRESEPAKRTSNCLLVCFTTSYLEILNEIVVAASQSRLDSFQCAITMGASMAVAVPIIFALFGVSAEEPAVSERTSSIQDSMPSMSAMFMNGNEVGSFSQRDDCISGAYSVVWNNKKVDFIGDLPRKRQAQIELVHGAIKVAAPKIKQYEKRSKADPGLGRGVKRMFDETLSRAAKPLRNAVVSALAFYADNNAISGSSGSSLVPAAHRCTLEFKSPMEKAILYNANSGLVKIASDLHNYAEEERWLTLAADLNGCDPDHPENYLLCVAHTYQRLIILNRHELNNSARATKWYNRAVAMRAASMSQSRQEELIDLQHESGPDWRKGKNSLVLNSRDYFAQNPLLMQWPSEWQLGLDFKLGLRSQPFWDGIDAPPFARSLEEQFHFIEKEFNDFLQSSAKVVANSKAMGQKPKSLWDQNDYFLQVPGAGAWSEITLFNNNVWNKRICKHMQTVCKLLRKMKGIVADTPKSLEGGSQQIFSNQVAIFKMAPGTKLAPHAGPANYRLYCHLGLVVPKGPWIKVGNEPEREWEKGKTVCFDDSYVHEAGHAGESGDRYVLMASFWHPDTMLQNRRPLKTKKTIETKKQKEPKQKKMYYTLQ